MKVFAYCCRSFVDSARKAAGVEPILCPPVTSDTFQPEWLAGCQFIYFDLHGEAGMPYWAGDNGLFALRPDNLKQANLGGATVFAASCHLGDADSPMLDALLSAGAGYVIGGAGVNYSGQASVFGAALLGMWVRRLISINWSPLEALTFAKRRVAVAYLSSELLDDTERETVNKDTLAFKAYARDNLAGVA